MACPKASVFSLTIKSTSFHAAAPPNIIVCMRKAITRLASKESREASVIAVSEVVYMEGAI